MRTTTPILATVLGVAAACTTYPDSCDRRALQERRTVDRLIASTETDLARGFTYETRESRFRTGLVVCSGSSNARICTGTERRPTRVPVAVDPAAEQRKLDSLRARRAVLAEATAACVPR